MGLFGGSTTTTTNEKFDSGPSKFQRPYLDQAFNAAQSAFNASQGTPYYQGDTYAGMSPEARQALQAMQGFATNTGLGAANTISGIGTNLAGYAQRAGSLIDDYTSMSSADAITSSAAKYANNPFLQGQIDAAASDVRRNLTEDILPSIDRGASATGNINSSRAGIASGIAQRGAAEAIANIGANLRSQAWDRGLGLAQDEAGSRLSAAQAYGNLGQQGIDALARGAETGYGAYDRINAGNLLEQQDRQGYLDQDFRRWEGNDMRQWDLLNRYYGVVGSNQWGQSGTSSSTSKTKEKGSILSQIVGAAATAASFIPSDRRLKIVRGLVGTLEDGLPIYVWSYTWDPDSVRIGPMAQDVAKYRPHALGPEIEGYMTIDLEKLYNADQPPSASE